MEEAKVAVSILNQSMRTKHKQNDIHDEVKLLIQDNPYSSIEEIRNQSFGVLVHSQTLYEIFEYVLQSYM
jgi:hypothetical protein